MKMWKIRTQRGVIIESDKTNCTDVFNGYQDWSNNASSAKAEIVERLAEGLPPVYCWSGQVELVDEQDNVVAQYPPQSIVGKLCLLDREFQVKFASMKLAEDSEWYFECETVREYFDDEVWEPALSHEGLKLAAQRPEQLCGLSTSWAMPYKDGDRNPEYPHSEIGHIYVFGHDLVHHCTLTFGQIKEGRIEVEWKGLCNIYWDEKYGEDVPFFLQCSAALENSH
jgi:hypothetical protein